MKNIRNLRGFTLLEILVSFAILALLLGAIYRVFGQSTVAAGKASKYNNAVLLAESLLAESGVTNKLESGTQSGVSHGGYHWSVVTREYQQAVKEKSIPASYLVSVYVGESSDEHFVALKTVRLGSD